MEISKKLVKLFTDNFGDSNSEVRAFYGSFDTDGNVIMADNKNGEIRITRGMLGADNPVGMVNRVPLVLHLDGKTYNGYLLYAACVNEEYRHRGIMHGLIDNANSDCDFTVLVPENDDLFSLYSEMGYSECEGCPFPVSISKSELNGIELAAANEDWHDLQKLEKKHNYNGYTFSGTFNAYILNTMKDCHIDYIKNDGRSVGYIIYKDTEDDNIVVCDMYCNGEASESEKALYEKLISQKHRKSMYRCGLIQIDKILPAINRCGEY